jgi:hypothetical protein
MSRRARNTVPAILALLGSASASLAAPSSAVNSFPQLGPQAAPQDVLHCDRQFEYRRKRLSCDSPLAADGEGLRPLLDSVPEARAELDLYQANRRSTEKLAYTGMAGLLVAILGPRLVDDRGSKNITLSVGLSLALGSFAFGRSRLAANEVHLDRAVQHFTRSNPGDPITLLPAGAPPLPEPPR